MLTFLNESDFLKVDTFKENRDSRVIWSWQDGEVTHSGDIYSGFMRTDGDGLEVDVWGKLIALEKAGKISVQWLSDADKAEIETLERQAIEKAEAQKTKLQGALISGEQISLTEENQNGMAAVMQGVNLAAEMGADIFPLNFNAQTPAGFKLMTFEAAEDFKTFCLTFMAERQKFFK